MYTVGDGHTCTSLIIKASDKDILVIAISLFQRPNDSGLEKLWIVFGQGINYLCLIPVHAIKHYIGSEKEKGIPFFHVFTGCDVLLAFRGKARGMYGIRGIFILKLQKSSVCLH